MKHRISTVLGSINAIRQSVHAWTQGPGGVVLGFGALILGGVAIILGLSWANGDVGEQSIEATEGIFFEIATGSVTGTYYPLGNVIASVIANPAGSVRCADETRCGPLGLAPVVQAAEGSVSNIEDVHDGRTASAFAQANVVNQAFLGQPPFETPYTDLRAVSGLYDEAVHLVTLRDSDIETLADLRGHRVSVDLHGSGTFGIATLVLDAAGLSARNTDLVHERSDRSIEMLLSGEIDAFFYVAGAPVRAVEDLANLNVIKLVPLAGSEIDALVAAEPYLTATVIPSGTYMDVPDTRTVGVTALWIVSEGASFDLVYRITRALWNEENRSLLAAGPEQAQFLRAQDAIEGVPIPFHLGAEQYYREAGLLPTE